MDASIQVLLAPGESLDEPLDEPLVEKEFIVEPHITHPPRAPVLPATMLLGALRHPRLRFTCPLTIALSTENEFILAECHSWGVMGYGTHLSAALVDLQDTIAELFLTLQEDRDTLAGTLPQVWTSMQQMIEAR